MMNKEEFLKLVEAKYAEISALKEEPSFLDYEKCFEELWTELGQQVKQAEQEDSGFHQKHHLTVF